MRDFQTNKEKRLDLVLGSPADRPKGSTLAGITTRYDVTLTPGLRADLDSLPPIHQAPVGSVRVAIEVKACMTAHIKAIPRLYDELNSSHQIVHGASDQAIAVGLLVVNESASFISTDRNKRPGAHGSPDLSRQDAHRPAAVISKVRQIPRRTRTGTPGFDAFGIITLDLVNDGSLPSLTGTVAPDDSDSYEAMVQRILELYAARFGA
jgi:hypothetical protein